MPWSVKAVSELRLAFVHELVTLHEAMAVACRKYGISRKTGYKWLRRYQVAPEAGVSEQSRRPKHSPGRTAEEVEQAVLAVRDRFGWGAGKIRDYLRAFDEPRFEAIDYEYAAEIHNGCRRRGIAGSSIDFLICAVAERRSWQIFTTDLDFEEYAKVRPLKLYS